jgi:UDP-N-acetylmuramate--alanine ligase
VITLAIDEKNEELIEAKRKGIKILSYPQALGEFTKKFDLISICGSHGKSTSTAMLADVFLKANFDPSVLLGTCFASLDFKNFRLGKSKYFIAESCEYKEAFLNYEPQIILITNIEADHLDYYKNEENYVKGFEKFIKNLRKGGVLIVNGDDKNIQRLTISNKRLANAIKIISFGEKKNNDYVLKGNKIYFKRNLIGVLNLKVPGKHNKINALSVFALSYEFGIKSEIILNALDNFKGTWRRLELKGKTKTGAIIYDDYAHHPTEVKASLEALKELYPKQRIICVFQPHQFSRTKYLFNDFAKSFQNADLVIIPNIYKVRDEEEIQISAEDLVNEISKYNKNVLFGDGFEKTASYLNSNSNKNDVIVVMGAGDVDKVNEKILDFKFFCI